MCMDMILKLPNGPKCKSEPKINSSTLKYIAVWIRKQL